MSEILLCFRFLSENIHQESKWIVCMPYMYKKSDVFFFFFTAKRRKIELILLQAALADYLQEG